MGSVIHLFYNEIKFRTNNYFEDNLKDNLEERRNKEIEVSSLTKM